MFLFVCFCKTYYNWVKLLKHLLINITNGSCNDKLNLEPK